MKLNGVNVQLNINTIDGTLEVLSEETNEILGIIDIPIKFIPNEGDV